VEEYPVVEGLRLVVPHQLHQLSLHMARHLLFTEHVYRRHLVFTVTTILFCHKPEPFATYT
jgi:hypothetical protein